MHQAKRTHQQSYLRVGQGCLGMQLIESSMYGGPFRDAAALVPMLHNPRKLTSSSSLTWVEAFLWSAISVLGGQRNTCRSPVSLCHMDPGN